MTESLNKLVPKEHFIPAFRKIINCNWYSYVSDSFYCVRIKTDAPSDGESIGLSMEKMFEPVKSKASKSVSMNAFDWLKTIDTTVYCEECDWNWEVERNYKDISRDFECPKCNGYPTTWSDPLENIYYKIFDMHINWRLLYKLLSVLWMLDISALWNIAYWVIWEYECIIKPYDVSDNIKARIIEI